MLLLLGSSTMASASSQGGRAEAPGAQVKGAGMGGRPAPAAPDDGVSLLQLQMAAAARSSTIPLRCISDGAVRTIASKIQFHHKDAFHPSDFGNKILTEISL